MISKYINAGGFAFVLICFLFPFVSIKCNERTLASLKGYEMVIGKDNLFGDKENKINSMFNDKTTEEIDTDNGEILEDNNHETEPTSSTSKSIAPSAFMILLMALAIIGVITMLLVKQKVHLVALIFSISMLAAMLIQAIVLENQVQDNSNKNEMYTVIIKIGYETGFWLMLISLIGLIGYNVVRLVNKTPATSTNSSSQNSDTVKHD